LYLGVDIGGTKILALVVSAQGKVLSRCKKKVKETDPESVLARAWQCSRVALREAGLGKKAITAMGLAVPSAVSDGIARFAPALGWRNTPVVELAQQHFTGPLFLGNDVNLGLAAEYVLGAARGCQTVLGFFLGTGVGGAVIHQGCLLHGEDGLAGELGHLIVVPDGRRCGCGNRGCLEAYASKTALLARLKEALFEQRLPSVLARSIKPETQMINSSQLFEAYQAKDPLTREVCDGGLRLMGPALASVINMLSPGRVVLGGGLVDAFGAPLIKRVRQWTRPYIFSGPERAQVIVQSALGDDSVPLGAALLAREAGKLLV
jgi:glucokinase